MRCPCGTNATVDITTARAEHRWSCNCSRCYDPVEDSGSRSHAIGYGSDPEEAIATWWEMVEQAWEIEYLPVMLFAELSEQAGDEADRQSEWVEKWATDPQANRSARWIGPAQVTP